jgi:hypothetical protein
MIKKGEKFKVTGICREDACTKSRERYLGQIYKANDDWGMVQNKKTKTFCGSAINVNSGLTMYFYSIQLKRVKD